MVFLVILCMCFRSKYQSLDSIKAQIRVVAFTTSSSSSSHNGIAIFLPVKEQADYIQVSGREPEPDWVIFTDQCRLVEGLVCVYVFLIINIRPHFPRCVRPLLIIHWIITLH